MKVHFTGRTPHLADPDPRRDRAAGVPPIPSHILDRHHARVLRPGEAHIAPGQNTPGGTIYRYDRLLLSQRLLNDAARLSELDNALAVHGIRVKRPDAGVRSRRARLAIGDRATPASLDAWKTVQTLRAAIHSGRCHEELSKRVRLEHLLVGSAYQGAGALVGAPGDWPSGGGPHNPPSTAAATYPGRVPVDLMLPMPPRRPPHVLPGGRRPVIAVVDTGIALGHPALDVSEFEDGQDTFVAVDTDFQGVLAAGADPETPILEGPYDVRVDDYSLLDEVTSHFGHGTFITGIIRQVAPDAQVRSYRVMHGDGLVYENELMGTLTHLADEAERARDGDETARPVDIIVLSMGYVDEDPDGLPTGGLRSVIDRLSTLGVAVVAAAGNFATSRPFYPAAFSAVPREPEAAPVISVGALNPNETVAMFSNEGPWLSCFATGAAMVSTFPTYASGPNEPVQGSNGGGRRRESLDFDDYSSGYAIWSGTSFAAPLVAAKLAVAMISADEPIDWGLTDSRAAANRMHAAVKALGG